MPRSPLPGFTTLADARGFDLMAHCRRCKSWTVLDTEAFADKLGWNYAAVRMEAQLKCTQCGAKDASLTYSQKRTARELKRMHRARRS
jgi:cytochrome c-type biogenesis protein CcmH/NrfF